jgi:hypothetical protein
MTSAVTEARRTTPDDSAEKSRRSSSSAKSTPAIGALKVAAPQATSSFRRGSATRNRCPSEDPSAEPICTIGPSRPTDPPPPMQIADASDFTPATAARMRPPFSATARMTSGMPLPRASRA